MTQTAADPRLGARGRGRKGRRYDGTERPDADRGRLALVARPCDGHLHDEHRGRCETGAIDDSIETGSGAKAIAVGAGSVWVTNAIGGTIVKIDPASNTIVSTVEIGNSPDGIAVAPGGTVWFTTHAP